jgi:hypothetical protein
MPEFRARRITGMVMYRDEMAPVFDVPGHFGEHLTYFAQILATVDAPMKDPGTDCAWCPIPARICPERVEAGRRPLAA